MASKIKTTRKGGFSAVTSRHFAGLLMAFITCVLMIPGMTTYLPFGAVDQIAIPILLFPFIWTALCLYSYLAEKAWQPWVLMLLLSAVHAALSFQALVG